MKEFLKEYFAFNKRERKGIVVLVIILLMLVIVNQTMHLFVKPNTYNHQEFKDSIELFLNSLKPKEKDDKEYLNRLDQYIVERYDSLQLFNFNPNITTEQEFKNLGLTDKQIKTISTYKERGGKFKIKSDFQKIYGVRQKQYEILEPYILLPEEITENNGDNNITLFQFDPNTATDEQWTKLGLSQKQIKTINNYKLKGGKFNTASDLSKIYSITNEQYIQLEPYIIIETNKDNADIQNITTEEQKISIEINAATKDELKNNLKITDKLANTIINYRKALGGYHDKSQLLEVSGITETEYKVIENQVVIITSNLIKININVATFKELLAHPYLEYEDVKNIVNRIAKKGKFTEISQLNEENIISTEIYNKIKYYLSTK